LSRKLVKTQKKNRGTTRHTTAKGGKYGKRSDIKIQQQHLRGEAERIGREGERVL